MMQNKHIGRIIRIIIGIIFLISGFGKLFGNGEFIQGIHFFDWRIIEEGLLSWLSTPLFTRLFVSLEIFIALAYLFRLVNPKALNSIFLLLLVIYSFDLFLGYNNMLTHSYPLLFLWNKYASIFIMPFLIFSFLFLKKTDWQANKWWYNLLAIIPVFALVFILNPIFIEDYQSIKTPYQYRSNDWEIVFSKCKIKSIPIEQENYLVVFASTSCSHCNELAKTLGVTKRGYASSRKILLVFPGKEEDAQAFIQRNKSFFEYIRVTPDQFVKIAGFSFPVVFSLTNKQTDFYWLGSNFSYKAIHEEFIPIQNNQ